MKTMHDHRWVLGPLAFVVPLALFACKDDSPCDEGQEERLAACYPINTGGTPGAAGTSAGPVDAGDGGVEATLVEAVIGQACADTVASSDCGGIAPICAPLPAGSACTQILCLDGEPNAGVCPSDWPCLVLGSDYPSTCLKL